MDFVMFVVIWTLINVPCIAVNSCMLAFLWDDDGFKEWPKPMLTAWIGVGLLLLMTYIFGFFLFK